MGNSEVRDQSVRSARLNEAFERLSSTLPLARSPISVPKPDFHSVLLTGSTGYIGSYILASLLQDETVNHIYCLHRGLNGAARQKTSFTEKGIPITSSFDLKVEFCSVNLYEKKLGLNDTAYDKLTDTVDMVIHNAWSVNYAFSLKSFEESDLLGLRNIVDLCLQSKHRPRLHFISSITTVAHWPQYYDAPLTERIVHDARLPIPIGYAESKYVAELFLEKAVEQSGLQCSIIRPSQIAGPTTIRGIWNPNDVVPILVSTSINLGVFPYHATDRLLIDWVPMVRRHGPIIFVLTS
ncbi:uncharacterized protein N7511_005340 [Penicillium nucicola]|uniref:uncharacterized protein n=1 Tax=Penicillium nucicola TaxID=1850975 RepID=UPI0025450EA8|nr:uncharacterized protein N7511_005340 [Penicillium nucicola]KAJ5761958.1 hypothetical protein N7511_005340 [Penicillium nucicola]